ncbi:MAG: leucyl aminopeptidase [Thermodesulfovibrionales bacterium]|nr:leucyl aminopeptidase [Thermodesulfovibrionales bacterium]
MVDFILKSKPSLKRLDTDLLIIPVSYDKVDEVISNEFLKDYSQSIRYVLSSGEFKKDNNAICLIHNATSSIKRILLVDFTPKDSHKVEDWILKEDIRRAGGRASRFLKDKGISDMSIYCEYLPKDLAISKPAYFYFLEGFLLSRYEFDGFKTTKKDKSGLQISIIGSSSINHLEMLNTLSSTSYFIRDMINSPSNHITPRRLLDIAKSIKSSKINVKALNFKQLEKEGLNGLLAVAKGSIEPPYLIVIEYNLKKDTPPIVLIGKSVTFDSGGISIKPSDGLEKMKYDMAGGAVVIGIMKSLVDLKTPCSVVGILPAVENMPSSKAYKPGDIIKMMSGKTVEIISTDAEGRMTLADAITYSKKYYNPSAIIDIATLTGACALTFANEVIGMMGNDEPLMQNLYNAGMEVYEMVWKMPLYREYGDYIKGDFADIKNSGGRLGSMLTAGYFLKEFAEDTPWVHLDVASTSWLEKDKPYLTKGASGSGYRLLLEMLLRKC